MRKLTHKFREFFENYDYREVDYNALKLALDIILDMMIITDYDDHKDIQTLAMFVKIISSDIEDDLIMGLLNDATVLESINDTKILPLLARLDEKYDKVENTKKSMHTIAKELMSGDYDKPQITKEEAVPEIDKVKIADNFYATTQNEDLVEKYKHLENSPCDIDISKLYPSSLQMSNSDTNDPTGHTETLFNMMKETSSKLYTIYTNIVSNYYNRKNLLRDLYEIKESVRIVKMHPVSEICTMATCIYELCNILITVLESNTTISSFAKEIAGVSFGLIDELKFVG